MTRSRVEQTVCVCNVCKDVWPTSMWALKQIYCTVCLSKLVSFDDACSRRTVISFCKFVLSSRKLAESFCKSRSKATASRWFVEPIFFYASNQIRWYLQADFWHILCYSRFIFLFLSTGWGITIIWIYLRRLWDKPQPLLWLLQYTLWAGTSPPPRTHPPLLSAC